MGVAYGDCRPQWAWPMATVGLSGRGLGRMSSNHVPELYFGLERSTPFFTLLNSLHVLLRDADTTVDIHLVTVN